MFRKLAHVVAATLVTTSLLTAVAAPASADGPGSLTITIGYDGTLPTAAGDYHLDGDGLVASIKGTLDGEPVDATSCEVDVTSLDAFLAGGSTAVIGSCGDGSGIAARLAPSVGPDGEVTTGGDVSVETIKWEVRGKCKGWYVFGFPLVVECEVTVTIQN